MLIRLRSTLVTAVVMAVGASLTAAAAPADSETPEQAYRRHLDAHEPTPLTREEAAQHKESSIFLAAAKNDQLSEHDTDELLSSGYWIGYPVGSTTEETTVDAEAETMTTTTTVENFASAGPAKSTSTTTALAATGCKSRGTTYWLWAADKRKFAYFQVNERFCFNGKRVTSYGTPNVNHKVYDWAAVLGWSWEGLDRSGSKGPEYYKWKGDSHGGLRTWRRGDFQYSQLHIDLGAIHRYPWIHIYERGDGTMKAKTGM
ncbi:hypothetical protein SGFS_076670 [Streptomyces graminofaciens]|uniref:Secreted protein n=1 Tax=Streptomyces graminofaciens TaxID=68212 RepID=A0ABN5VV15_9ACTN|nr:hypothetical protein [Streptomyces graminofaciens]BBC36373.1 hypothetical protein SGFS_076670 [Streptomyces graminofaciens]